MRNKTAALFCVMSGYGLRRFLLASGLLVFCTLASTPAFAGDTVYYYYTDAVHSAVAVTDAHGNVIERTYYAPYGAVLNRDLRDGPGYSGHEEDPETGLVYMQQRYYDPEAGQFLSVDPVDVDPTSGGNFNRYEYAKDNPYRYTDPDGRKTTCTGGGKNMQCITTADNSNGTLTKTAVASASDRAVMDAGKSRLEVPTGNHESGGYVAPDAKGNSVLTVQSDAQTRPGSTQSGDTNAISFPKGTTLLAHGHIDSGPNKSNGMVDDPKSNGGLGDAVSLKLSTPIPMATVSNGQVGYHEMVNGTLQFAYPGSALDSKQQATMQTSLNLEQQVLQQSPHQ